MRRVFQLLGFAALLSLSACGGSSSSTNSAENSRKLREERYQAKVTAAREAFEAGRFDDAIASLGEAETIDGLDEAASKLLSRARTGKRAALVSSGRQAMKTGNYEDARKAFADALAIAIDDDVRGLLNQAVTGAWKQAGAEVGWVRVTGEGLSFSLEEQPEDFVPPKNQAYLYYRSFKFRTWKPGLLATLPPPQESFGLDLSATSFGDDAVEELSGFKSIYILNVRLTPLTNGGRERLRRTVSVQWLSL